MPNAQVYTPFRCCNLISCKRLPKKSEGKRKNIFFFDRTQSPDYLQRSHSYEMSLLFRESFVYPCVSISFFSMAFICRFMMTKALICLVFFFSFLLPWPRISRNGASVSPNFVKTSCKYSFPTPLRCSINSICLRTRVTNFYDWNISE